MTPKFARLQNDLAVPAPLMPAVIVAAALVTKSGHPVSAILGMAIVLVLYVLRRLLIREPPVHYGDHSATAMR
jgi:membrane protein YdbS with pleckstrin-like domain